ncbi:hypothetical protein SAMN05216421_0926 [Halopseudomonas xinjiangensis]|uniref:Uncharacterized protein n=1 Tax=Halopseudomonas xinjiangensis TaxID=487184 RepID=A0A1H1PIP4_9GAMM|nr:hypothetical protein [Halopseudomonas xinjiangensis]SDS11122.1 hypothetical protein SAMN05216421_0926 [Halopseudomonas xinjiangensis]
MQTLKMLTAAITFASLGMAGTAMAESSTSAGSAGGQTTSTTQSTGQGSASGTTGSMGSSGNQSSAGNQGSQQGQSEATTREDPKHARDTHESAYKKTYPNEKPIGGGELGPDDNQKNGTSGQNSQQQ